MLSDEVIKALEKLNKGSYNKAIEHLLNLNPDNKIISKVKQLEEEMVKIQEAIERLIRLNNLKFSVV